MAGNGISTVTFDLSMIDPDTGRHLKAKLYNVTVTDTDGVTSTETSLRNLSIGQLVMAICLERAVAMEKEIIRKMDSLNSTATQLEALTEIETAIVGGTVDLTSAMVSARAAPPNGTTYIDYLENTIRLVDVPSSAGPDSYEFISKLEQAMDQRNSINQQTMIELQSATSKRDQSYDMISNILKSLNQVLVGNANNM